MFFAIKRLYRRRFSRRSDVIGFVGPGCISSCDITTLVLATLIFSSLLSIGDACSSRSTPKLKPPAVVGSTPRPNITFHTYACPPMHASWYCLNGATCFTVKIGEHTLYNCECAEGYMGPRCEFKDLDSSYLLSRKQVLLETASIAFGATLAILLVVIVCASLYIRYSRLQKQRRELSVTSCVDSGGVKRRKPFSRRIPATPLPLVNRYPSTSSSTTSSVSSFRTQQLSSFAIPSSVRGAPTTASSCCYLSEDRQRQTIDSNYFLFSPDVDVETGRNMTNNDGNPVRHYCAFHHHRQYCCTEQNQRLHYLLMQKEAPTNKTRGYNNNNSDNKIDHDKTINNIDEGTKLTNTNSYDRGAVHFQHEADDWCSETVPSLCLRIMKKIEALFTFELPLRRIFENLIKVLITNDQDDDDGDDDKRQSKIEERRRLFRRADIVELCGQPLITLLSDHHHYHHREHRSGNSLIHNSTVAGSLNGATTAYKVLTLVPAVCIPMETNNILLVDVKLDELASKQFSYVQNNNV